MAGIMIVDDAAFMRSVLKKILGQAGFNVVGEARDGSELLEKFPEVNPDLVLLDIVMPPSGEMRHGIHVLKHLLAQYPEAKVIMCSSLGHQGLIKEAIDSGAKDYIVKPFKPSKVVEAVSKYCFN
jgi:two-component system chemotaxis response regulator CheY